LAGQLVCDLNDDRSDAFAPADCAGDPEKKRAWAVETMKNSAKAAKNLGLKVVNGFTGSSIWHYLYSFPPVTSAMIDEGFAYFAKMWNPILDVFDECGVKFALEVHPTEIAFDICTAQRALDAVGNRETFGFNYDPSHLGYQGVDYVKFIRTFPDRIYHVHMKDAWWGHGDGTVGVFGGHTEFADPRRYWDFRSLGHGDIDFEEIIVALNDIGYQGPLSVEWEDSRMDRDHGAKEACDFVKSVDFAPSNVAFDAAFDEENR
jgi:sugar phosphate isomerase/epimerase